MFDCECRMHILCVMNILWNILKIYRISITTHKWDREYSDRNYINAYKNAHNILFYAKIEM